MGKVASVSKCVRNGAIGDKYVRVSSKVLDSYHKMQIKLSSTHLAQCAAVEDGHLLLGAADRQSGRLEPV